MPAAVQTVPGLSQQVERLIALGVHEIGGLSAAELRAAVAEPEDADALLVIHPDRAPASALALLLEHGGKRGFIVVDMPDVDDFSPIEQIALPPGPVYLVSGLDRGDHMANWSPDEALPAITAAERTPLTVVEGIHWVLQQPDVLARGHCFMTIGSRLRKPTAHPTPAPPHCGSATAPDAMAETTATHQNSDGAGPATGTPGSGSPLPPDASRQRADPAR